VLHGLGYEVSETGTGLSAQLVETLTLGDVDIGQNSHRYEGSSFHM